MTATPEALRDNAANQVHLEQLRFLTENYTQLQGLRLVPLGLVFLFKAILWSPSAGLWPMALTLLVGFALFHWIGNYYKQVFGRVHRRLRSHLLDGAVILSFLTVFFTGLALEKRYDVPVSLVGLSVSGLFVLVYLRSRGRRSYYAYVAAAFALLSCLPLIGFFSRQDLFGATSLLGDLALGVTYVLVGVMDHLFLTRSLKPIPKEADDDAL